MGMARRYKEIIEVALSRGKRFCDYFALKLTTQRTKVDKPHYI